MMNETRTDREGCCGDLSLEDCHKAMEKLDELLDHEITPEARILLEKHLRLCDHCTEEYDLRSQAQEILRAKLCDERCPDTLRASISAIIHEESPGC